MLVTKQNSRPPMETPPKAHPHSVRPFRKLNRQPTHFLAAAAEGKGQKFSDFSTFRRLLFDNGVKLRLFWLSLASSASALELPVSCRLYRRESLWSDRPEPAPLLERTGCKASRRNPAWASPEPSNRKSSVCTCIRPFVVNSLIICRVQALLRLGAKMLRG